MKRILILSFLVFLAQCLFAQYQMFYVFLNNKPDKEIISQDSINNLQELHLNNISRLYKAGKIIAAGPFEGGGGHFIMLDTDSLSVHSLLQTDPAIAAERFLIEIFPLKLIKGGVCRPYEPFEMLSYHFARLDADTSQTLPDKSLLEASNNYILSQEGISTFGWLGNYQSAFILFNTNSDDAHAILKKNPLIRKKHHSFQLKKLWVGKGTYCD